MPIFRVKSVKIYTGQKNLHWRRRPRRRQLSGMEYPSDPGKYAHNKQLFSYVKKFLVSTKRLVYKSKLQYNPL